MCIESPQPLRQAALWKPPCSRYVIVILTEQPQRAEDPAETKKPGTSL